MWSWATRAIEDLTHLLPNPVCLIDAQPTQPVMPTRRLSAGCGGRTSGGSFAMKPLRKLSWVGVLTINVAPGMVRIRLGDHRAM